MQSRVGGAAISVPPEVSLNLVDIPKSATRVRGKDVPKFTAEIKGPKGMFGVSLGVDGLVLGVKLIHFFLIAIAGEMSLTIPSFLDVNYDAANSKATLSVSDSEQPHQRAMWGAYCRRIFKTRQTTLL
jgi:large subunit ribosomal protein L6